MKTFRAFGPTIGKSKLSKKIITILINKYLPCLNDCLKIGKNDIMSNY